MVNDREKRRVETINKIMSNIFNCFQVEKTPLPLHLFPPSSISHSSFPNPISNPQTIARFAWASCMLDASADLLGQRARHMNKRQIHFEGVVTPEGAGGQSCSIAGVRSVCLALWNAPPNKNWLWHGQQSRQFPHVCADPSSPTTPPPSPAAEHWLISHKFSSLMNYFSNRTSRPAKNK